MTITLDFNDPLPPGWSEIVDSDAIWTDLEQSPIHIDLRHTHPQIVEPTPSVTFDLRPASSSPGFHSARKAAINAEALRCFTADEVSEMNWLALDWRHPCYRFVPAQQARTREQLWRIPVYPDGDFYIFVEDTYRTGTFGHPWEKTLCVFGSELVDTLAQTLRVWLPVLRVNGLAIQQ